MRTLGGKLKLASKFDFSGSRLVHFGYLKSPRTQILEAKESTHR